MCAFLARPVIADLGFAEQVDLAFEIHDEMRKAGIPPSTNTYNRLLGVCEKVLKKTRFGCVMYYQ